jgi:hypothetical protein
MNDDARYHEREDCLVSRVKIQAESKDFFLVHITHLPLHLQLCVFYSNSNKLTNQMQHFYNFIT